MLFRSRPFDDDDGGDVVTVRKTGTGERLWELASERRLTDSWLSRDGAKVSIEVRAQHAATCAVVEYLVATGERLSESERPALDPEDWSLHRWHSSLRQSTTIEALKYSNRVRINRSRMGECCIKDCSCQQAPTSPYASDVD